MRSYIINYQINLFLLIRITKIYLDNVCGVSNFKLDQACKKTKISFTSNILLINNIYYIYILYIKRIPNIYLMFRKRNK